VPPAGGSFPDMSGRHAVNHQRVRIERSHHLNFPRAFHVRLPAYAPTPLLEAPDLAAELGVASLWVKDESRRFQMHGYELLGTAWALYREVLGRLMRRVRWDSIDELVEKIAPVGELRIVVVSDNHFGVAAARAAQLLGYACAAYVPAECSPGRLRLLAAEGAEVVAVPGGYDAALAAAARDTGDHTVVLSDSSWPEYEELPGWVTEGYTTIFEEAVDEMERRGAGAPDAVFVPLGVGALAACAGDHFRVEKFPEELALVGVEPTDASCFVESCIAGRRVAMPHAAPSVMDGLARGLPSPLAWDVVSTTFDAFLAIDDARAQQAVAHLEAAGVIASPAGAAALGGLVELRQLGATVTGPGASADEALAVAALVPATAAVLVVVTEAPVG